MTAAKEATDAIADGRLIPSECWACGNPTAVGHHEDYERPLDVVWLCLFHHKRRHLGDSWAELRASGTRVPIGTPPAPRGRELAAQRERLRLDEQTVAREAGCTIGALRRIEENFHRREEWRWSHGRSAVNYTFHAQQIALVLVHRGAQFENFPHPGIEDDGWYTVHPRIDAA